MLSVGAISAIHSHQFALLSFYVQCAQSSEDIKRHAKTRPWTAASRFLVYSTAGKLMLIFLSRCSISVVCLLVQLCSDSACW
jgi:hypothetical protein